MTKVKRFAPKQDIQKILKIKHAWYPDDAFYKPIGINIQGNLFCPVGCNGCGIDAQRSHSSNVELPFKTRVNLLEQAVDLGFLSYLGCIGNAEPFTSLDTLEYFITQFHGRADLTKINTSCFTFTSEKQAIQQLKNLRDIGWTNTKYFYPVLSISLGMQQSGTPGVPLERIINGILAFHTQVMFSDARRAE